MTIEITNVLNEFLKTQGYAEDEICVEYRADEDSYYDESTSTPLIVLGGLTNKKADEIFMQFCKERLGLVTDVDIITLTFLHELGHHNTIDFLDDEEMEASEWTKFMLNMKETTEEDNLTEEDYMSYFTCPIEMEATIDAVEFCNHCPKAAMKLNKELINAFYRSE